MSSGPSGEALDDVRRLAEIRSVTRLEGGVHADTWRVETERPDLTVVVREFPAGDPAAADEQQVLRTLDGLGGLAPLALGGEGRRSLISWLDGRADITPADPESWAAQLGDALATVHAVPDDRLTKLPSVFDRRRRLTGPLAPGIRSRWTQITGSAEVLTHGDYWSGNTVWRDGRLTGIVDWEGAARGPRGYDVSWCRLDLVLLADERIADVFLAAYEDAIGRSLDDMALWDGWALARSHDSVETWVPNYAPLGRADLTRQELRRRHSMWTARLLGRGDK